MGPYGHDPLWAPTGREAADFDTDAIQVRGVPESTLMENAGRSAALLVDELFPRGPVVALVGSGNNGGDALVLLRNLSAWGRSARGVAVGKRGAGDPVLHHHDVPVDPWPSGDGVEADALLAGAEVLVDGLLGTGLGGAPRSPYAEAIRALNEASAPVLALDVPSGVDADTGAVPGEAVRADVTVAFGWPKLGSLLHPGRGSAGRLLAVEIGFPEPEAERFGARLITPAWAATQRPSRSPVTHKNRVGSLLLLAGRRGMAGASVLAARAALRAGVGLLRVAGPPDNREIVQTAVPEALYVDRSDSEALEEACRASTAVAAGPGLGTDDEAREALDRVLEAAHERPTVLDADALNLSAGGRVPSLTSVAGTRPLLVTPHPGEMARLGTKRPPEDVVADPVGVARALAGETGAVTLLKGTPSVVAHPEGAVLLECVSSSDLAVGGMGDVLTGAAGAFLAQRAGPAAAGGLALHVTGLAARRSGGGSGFVPSDAVEGIPGALRSEPPEPTHPFVIFDQEAPR